MLSSQGSEVFPVLVGTHVRDCEGARLGRVASCGPETFIVEKGFFFPREYEIGYGAVAIIGAGEIWLVCDKASLERRAELPGRVTHRDR